MIEEYYNNPQQEPTITPVVKQQWNNFLDFVHEKGYRGSKDLDKRDTELGRKLLDEFRAKNPNTVLTYDLVKPIQEATINEWNLIKKVNNTGKTDSEVEVRKVSPPDGWLGSLTSNAYFPTATTTDDKGKVVKDWGFDIQSYYNALSKNK